jgi:hypothetical protein
MVVVRESHMTAQSHGRESLPLVGDREYVALRVTGQAIGECGGSVTEAGIAEKE